MESSELRTNIMPLELEARVLKTKTECISKNTSAASLKNSSSSVVKSGTKECKNVSLLSVKVRRSVGYSAGVISTENNAKRMQSNKAQRRRRILPPNLHPLSANFYSLSRNKRSFGEQYHPDVRPSTKTAAKIKQLISSKTPMSNGNSKETLPQSMKEKHPPGQRSKSERTSTCNTKNENSKSPRTNVLSDRTCSTGNTFIGEEIVLEESEQREVRKKHNGKHGREKSDESTAHTKDGTEFTDETSSNAENVKQELNKVFHKLPKQSSTQSIRYKENIKVKLKKLSGDQDTRSEFTMKSDNTNLTSNVLNDRPTKPNPEMRDLTCSASSGLSSGVGQLLIHKSHSDKAEISLSSSGIIPPSTDDQNFGPLIDEFYDDPATRTTTTLHCIDGILPISCEEGKYMKSSILPSGFEVTIGVDDRSNPKEISETPQNETSDDTQASNKLDSLLPCGADTDGGPIDTGTFNNLCRRNAKIWESNRRKLKKCGAEERTCCEPDINGLVTETFRDSCRRSDSICWSKTGEIDNAMSATAESMPLSAIASIETRLLTVADNTSHSHCRSKPKRFKVKRMKPNLNTAACDEISNSHANSNGNNVPLFSAADGKRSNVIHGKTAIPAMCKPDGISKDSGLKSDMNLISTSEGTSRKTHKEKYKNKKAERCTDFEFDVQQGASNDQGNAICLETKHSSSSRNMHSPGFKINSVLNSLEDEFGAGNSCLTLENIHGTVASLKLELDSDSDDGNFNSVTSQVSTRLDWTNVDFSSFYYNSDSELTTPQASGKEAIRDSEKQPVSLCFTPIDIDRSDKRRIEVDKQGRLFCNEGDVGCVSERKSTHVNHHGNQATVQRHTPDESQNKNNFFTPKEIGRARKLNNTAPVPSSRVKVQSTCEEEYFNSNEGVLRITGNEVKFQQKQNDDGSESLPYTGSKIITRVLSNGCASDVTTKNVISTDHRRFYKPSDTRSTSCMTDENEIVKSDAVNTNCDIYPDATSCDILPGNFSQQTPDASRFNYSRTQASTRPSRRRYRRLVPGSSLDQATGIAEKSNSSKHVCKNNTASHAVSLRGNNEKNVFYNTESTTTNVCCGGGVCLAIQTDSPHLDDLSFCSEDDLANLKCASERNVERISKLANAENKIDTGNMLANMTDIKPKLMSAKKPKGEKIGRDSRSVISPKASGADSKNRSPSACTRASPRSVGGLAQPRSPAEQPVTCKCRERAVEIKLGITKPHNVVSCRRNCSSNERSVSGHRSDESTTRKSVKLIDRSTDNDRTMDTKKSKKMVSRPARDAHEIKSPPSTYKLTPTNVHSDTQLHDRAMSKQSTGKKVDEAGRVKISRPRSGQSKPDDRARESKDRSPSDRSDVSAVSCSTRNSLSTKARSNPSSGAGAQSKLALVRTDKPKSSLNKPTSRISPRTNAAKPARSSANSQSNFPSPRSEIYPRDGCANSEKLPRYLSGSTVSSRNKSIRISRNSEKECAAETTSPRDQSVTDSAPKKSYSSRSSIPASTKSQINQGKPVKIINKSKCSKKAVPPSRVKSEDAAKACHTADLSQESASVDEIQTSNSNCESLDDVSIKTEGESAGCSKKANSEASQDTTSSLDSTDLNVYLTESVDSDSLKDGDVQDNFDKCTPQSTAINTKEGGELPLQTINKKDTLSATEPNCEGRYKQAVSLKRNFTKKLESKSVPVRTKIVEENCNVSNEQSHSRPNLRASKLSKTNHIISNRGSISNTSVSKLASRTKSVSERKPDAPNSGKGLVASTGKSKSIRQSEAVATKSTSRNSPSESCSNENVVHAETDHSSLNCKENDISIGFTKDDKELNSSELKLCPDVNSKDVLFIGDSHGQRENDNPLNGDRLQRSCDKPKTNSALFVDCDPDLKTLKTNSEEFVKKGDKKQSGLYREEKSEQFKRLECERVNTSKQGLDYCVNDSSDNSIQELEEKITNKDNKSCDTIHEYETSAINRNNEGDQVFTNESDELDDKLINGHNVVGKGFEYQHSKHNKSSEKQLLEIISTKEDLLQTKCQNKQNSASALTNREVRSELGAVSHNSKSLRSEVLSTAELPTVSNVNNASEEKHRVAAGEEIINSTLLTQQDGSFVNANGADDNRPNKNEETDADSTILEEINSKMKSSKPQFNITIAPENGGQNSKGTVHLIEENSNCSPDKLHSVSVSCINWNTKHSCVEENPRVLSEVALVSKTPKVERSSICFLPSLRTQMIPSTVKLDNWSDVLHLTPPVLQETAVQDASDFELERCQDFPSSQQDNVEPCVAPVTSVLTSGTQNSSESMIQVSQKSFQIGARDNVSEAETNSRNDIQNGNNDCSEIVEIHSSNTSNNSTVMSTKPNAARKIPVLLSTINMDQRGKAKGSPNIVIQYKGSRPLEVTVTKNNNRSAKRVASISDLATKKKQTDLEEKEKSKSISDLRHESNTVIVNVQKKTGPAKFKSSMDDRNSRPNKMTQTGIPRAQSLTLTEASKEKSSSTSSLFSQASDPGCLSKGHRSSKHTPLRKTLQYSGLVKKIALLNTPLKNRSNSNPDLAKELSTNEKSEISQPLLPTSKAPKIKTGTVKNIKVNKPVGDFMRNQKLSKHKSKSTSDLTGSFGLNQNFSKMAAKTFFEADMISGNLIKNQQNKKEIMKFSANFYSNFLDDDEVGEQNYPYSSIVEESCTEPPKVLEVAKSEKKTVKRQKKKPIVLTKSSDKMTVVNVPNKYVMKNNENLTKNSEFHSDKSSKLSTYELNDKCELKEYKQNCVIDNRIVTNSATNTLKNKYLDSETGSLAHEDKSLEDNADMTDEVYDPSTLTEMTFDPVCSSTGRFETLALQPPKLDDNDSENVVKSTKDNTLQNHCVGIGIFEKANMKENVGTATSEDSNNTKMMSGISEEKENILQEIGTPDESVDVSKDFLDMQIKDLKDRLFEATFKELCKNSNSGVEGENIQDYFSDADQSEKPVFSCQTPRSDKVSGRYTEAQLKKIRSDGKTLMQKRSTVPKGLVEDTVQALATHLEGLLGTIDSNHTENQDPCPGARNISGASKVNFLKKRFESDKSSEEIRKDRANERCRLKKKLPRPLSVQITENANECLNFGDISKLRHSVIMSSSSESSVSRDSGLPPDLDFIDFTRPSELKERPPSFADSDCVDCSRPLDQNDDGLHSDQIENIADFTMADETVTECNEMVTRFDETDNHVLVQNLAELCETNNMLQENKDTLNLESDQNANCVSEVVSNCSDMEVDNTGLDHIFEDFHSTVCQYQSLSTSQQFNISDRLNLNTQDESDLLCDNSGVTNGEQDTKQTIPSLREEILLTNVQPENSPFDCNSNVLETNMAQSDQLTILDQHPPVCVLHSMQNECSVVGLTVDDLENQITHIREVEICKSVESEIESKLTNSDVVVVESCSTMSDKGFQSSEENKNIPFAATKKASSETKKEANPPSSNANCQNDVKMRLKPKVNFRTKNNRISSTISIFEGKPGSCNIKTLNSCAETTCASLYYESIPQSSLTNGASESFEDKECSNVAINRREENKSRLAELSNEANEGDLMAADVSKKLGMSDYYDQEPDFFLQKIIALESKRQANDYISSDLDKTSLDKLSHDDGQEDLKCDDFGPEPNCDQITETQLNSKNDSIENRPTTAKAYGDVINEKGYSNVKFVYNEKTLDLDAKQTDYNSVEKSPPKEVMSSGGIDDGQLDKSENVENFCADKSSPKEVMSPSQSKDNSWSKSHASDLGHENVDLDIFKNNMTERSPLGYCNSVIGVTGEIQPKSRRYKSPARETFSTPARYQSKHSRSNSRESRSRSKERPLAEQARPKQRSESPNENQTKPSWQNTEMSCSIPLDTEKQRNGQVPIVLERPTVRNVDSRQSVERATVDPHGNTEDDKCVEICAPPLPPKSKKISEFLTGKNIADSDVNCMLNSQFILRKCESFGKEPGRIGIVQQTLKNSDSCSSSKPSRSSIPERPSSLDRQRTARRYSGDLQSNPDQSFDMVTTTTPISCPSQLKILLPDERKFEQNLSEPSKQELCNKKSAPKAIENNNTSKTSIPVPTIKIDESESAIESSNVLQKSKRRLAMMHSVGSKDHGIQRGRPMARRIKSPTGEIFPNKLSVCSMDSTKLSSSCMSPERKEVERLYAKALAELSYDEGEEEIDDENDKTLIATNENSASPVYSTSANRLSPCLDSPRSRTKRSLSLPSTDLSWEQKQSTPGPVCDREDHGANRSRQTHTMGHKVFGSCNSADMSMSPEQSPTLKRKSLKVPANHEEIQSTPGRPSSYQNAMDTTVLPQEDESWAPFTQPVHHFVLPRQQSMLDISSKCSEENLADEDDSHKYHTIGRCQRNQLMAECPRLQRNASFYAAQKKGAIPLAVSTKSNVSSPILEERSFIDDNDDISYSGSSDRSFDKTKEAKSPGIIKRMLRRHRSFNDRDKDRGVTSPSKDQSFFKFPALKSILRRGSKDLVKLGKDSDSVNSEPIDHESAPLAKFQMDSDIDSVPGSPYASSRRLRRSLTAGELIGYRSEKRRSFSEQLPVNDKDNTFACSEAEEDDVSINSMSASPIRSPSPCPPLPARQKPYSRSSSFSVHFTDQSHTEEYSDGDNQKLTPRSDCVTMDPIRNHFLHQNVTSSNSNDSGIQNDSSAHSSSESLKDNHVMRREMPRRHQERPKSDCNVRWAVSVEQSTGETSLTSTNSRRSRSDRHNSDLGDLSTLSIAMQQFNQLSKMQHSISMKNIRRKKVLDGESGGKSRRMSTPHPIKNRQENSRPDTARKPRIQRSLSMPVNLDKLRRRKRITSFFGFDASGNYCSPDHFSDDSSDDSENSMEVTLKDKCHSTRASHAALTSILEKPLEECLTYAEALWDHVTMDPEELAFRAGDLIEVTDTADKDWWWGAVEDREGWFPAAFVRLRANQGHLDDDLENIRPLVSMETCHNSPEPSRRLGSSSGVTRDQARTNVINEILQAEKDYVKHLHDVIEGYIRQARRHPDMFSEKRIQILFGNLEEIYDVSSQFVKDLEKSYNPNLPHLTDVGQCFLNSKKDFEIYSDYCNNHPDACKELQELYRNKRYRHFFEACRLLQEMIQIPLEGFLLTPVQKICKYPLQLSELLKFTDPEHSDYDNVCQALDAMKRIARLINERKRKMESIAKISAWQQSVEDWEGCDLLASSSELIHSGESHKVNRSGRSQERSLFLFDHQLIYCKKDLLRRNGFCYKGRVGLDQCEITVLPDGKDLQYNVTVRNGWKLHDRSQNKWFLFFCKTAADREKWLKAFSRERQQVHDDQENEFTIPRQVPNTGLIKSRTQLDKPKGKPVVRRMSLAPYYKKDMLRNLHSTLPRSIGQSQLKKKSWFNFISKKTKT